MLQRNASVWKISFFVVFIKLLEIISSRREIVLKITFLLDLKRKIKYPTVKLIWKFHLHTVHIHLVVADPICLSFAFLDSMLSYYYFNNHIWFLSFVNFYSIYGISFSSTQFACTLKVYGKRYLILSKINYIIDIDECASGKGGCSDSCVNTAGSFVCSCPSGKYLDSDGKTCKGKILFRE